MPKIIKVEANEDEMGLGAAALDEVSYEKGDCMPRIIKIKEETDEHEVQYLDGRCKPFLVKTEVSLQ